MCPFWMLFTWKTNGHGNTHIGSWAQILKFIHNSLFNSWKHILSLLFKEAHLLVYHYLNNIASHLIILKITFKLILKLLWMTLLAYLTNDIIKTMIYDIEINYEDTDSCCSMTFLDYLLDGSVWFPVMGKKTCIKQVKEIKGINNESCISIQPLNNMLIDWQAMMIVIICKSQLFPHFTLSGIDKITLNC